MNRAMKVTYYKSALCPRCWFSDRRLQELRAKHPEVEIETVEVLADPRRALRDKVMMLPTIIIGNQRWQTAPPLAELEAALDGV